VEEGVYQPQIHEDDMDWACLDDEYPDTDNELEPFEGIVDQEEPSTAAP